MLMETFILDRDGLYKEIKDYQKADWFHFEKPTPEEIEYLNNELGMPADFVIDGMDIYEVPRQEVYKGEDGKVYHLLLVLYPKIKKQLKDYREYQTLPLSIVIYNNKVFTFCSETPPFLKAIIHNTNQSPDNPLTGRHIILDILWELTLTYIEGITEIDQTIEQMEKNIVSTTKNEAFYKLIAIHKNLVYFDTGITENHKIIDHLIDSELYSGNPKGKSLLHDIKVISHQADIMINEANQMIDHLSEVFSNVISNNLNNIMKFLTSLTIVLTIPTIVGSFWGMNVGLPISKSPLAFLILILLSFVLSILTVYWLKKKDYL